MKKQLDYHKPIFIGLTIICFLLWLAWPVIVRKCAGDNLSGMGAFGDLYGGINSLFTAAAFVGLIYTILQQKTELRLQREELAYTRNELKGQKQVMQQQADNLEVQRFEGTFFQMLRLHNDMLCNFEMHIGRKKDNVISTGRDYLAEIKYQLNVERPEKQSSEELRDAIINRFKNLNHKEKHDLDIYYRSLHNLVQFIDESLESNQKFYTNIVRARLSEQELLLILYDSLSNKNSKFTSLILKYELLKHLRHDRDLIDFL